MRRAAKRDGNERRIIAYLKRVGCSVLQLSQAGAPDLLIGFDNVNLLAEIKSKSGTLTSQQTEFFNVWSGQKSVIHSVAEAKQLLKSIMPTRIYECSEHGLFEKKERISQEPLKICPQCGKDLAQRYFAPPVLFRGNGWGGKKDEQITQPK